MSRMRLGIHAVEVSFTLRMRRNLDTQLSWAAEKFELPENWLSTKAPKELFGFSMLHPVGTAAFNHLLIPKLMPSRPYLGALE